MGKDFLPLFAEVGGLRMFAQVSDQDANGASDLVLVHGLGLSGTYLMPTARELVDDCRVWIPDLPGFGRSGKPDHVLDVPELADALAAWMAAVGLERAALLGNSFGCQIIVECCARHPRRVTRAVLQGPTTPPEERSWHMQFIRWRQNPTDPPRADGPGAGEVTVSTAFSRAATQTHTQVLALPWRRDPAGETRPAPSGLRASGCCPGYTAGVLARYQAEVSPLLREPIPMSRFQFPLRLRRLLISSALAPVLVITAASSAAEGGDDLAPLETVELRVQGLHRTLRLYQPERLADRPALVIALHGAGGDGERLRHLTGAAFDALADARGWVLAYPDALGKRWNDCRSRTPYREALAGVDDVVFLRAVIDEARHRSGQSLADVYAVGYSNGGHLVFRLALEAPELFSAFAVFGAHMPIPEELECIGTGRPVSMLIVSGTEDPINPWDGGDVSPPGDDPIGRVRSASATARYFAELAGLVGTPVVEQLPDRMAGDEARVETSRWGDSPGPEVVLLAVHGGGHTLPHPTAPFPAAIVGRTSRDLNAAAYIGRFFARHARR